MLTTTLRSLLLFTVVLGAAGECPPDFIHLGDECYLFVREPMIRDEASDYCVSLGGQLASFQTCSLFTQVSRYLEVEQMDTGGMAFWVGASRSSGDWAWTGSSSPLLYGAPYWDPFNLVVSEEHNCAVMPPHGGYFMPEKCDVLSLPICEAPLLKAAAPTAARDPPAPRVTCPTPFEAVGDRCFYMNDEFLTWDRARTRCGELAEDYNSDLAVLSDCELFTAIVRLLEDKQGTTGTADWVWVGAHLDEYTGQFRWLDGNFANTGVPFWCPGQPNNFENRQSCVMLWGSNFFYGADEDCSSIHRSLCELGL
ncbi:uncharacterized protein [Panulirus ornatus]|uniref:uncharacterized protein n=1 Tax=Panulirus ornatus TaxID=150431 RepID=UPI003A83C2DA